MKSNTKMMIASIIQGSIIIAAVHMLLNNLLPPS